MIEALAARAAVAVSAQLFVGLRHFRDARWAPWRNRRGRALVLAARLHSELHKELDRLEDQNRLLRAHILRATGLQDGGPSAAIFGPDFPEALHATMIVNLRERAEWAYEGMEHEKCWRLGDRCLVLAELTAEVREIASEMKAREKTWGFSPNRWRSFPKGVVLTPPMRQGSTA